LVVAGCLASVYAARASDDAASGAQTVTAAAESSTSPQGDAPSFVRAGLAPTVATQRVFIAAPEAPVADAADHDVDAPRASCDDPPSQEDPSEPAFVPDDAQKQCDDRLGWRTFAWIGESGDGIVRIERAAPDWVVVSEGPYCIGGVAAATPRQLAALGMPRALADTWGYSELDCPQ
jgi:hypothetical protein